MNWEQVYIKKGLKKIFCNQYITDKRAMNIIVTHTPIVCTYDLLKVYEPLTQHKVNVFAIDFSGTGKSEGDKNKFSRKSIIEDLDTVIEYIKENLSDDIYLYGSTGIGGVFAQYYVSERNNVKAFAQFACMRYKHTQELGYPLWLIRCVCPLLKVLPNIMLRFTPPKYNGVNAELDNAFYEVELKNKSSYNGKCSSKIMLAFLESAILRDSSLRKEIKIPTLVFKTRHDRYFPRNYFDKYYEGLLCEKKLVEIDDVHNSYYLHSEQFCEEVYNWFSMQHK